MQHHHIETITFLVCSFVHVLIAFFFLGQSLFIYQVYSCTKIVRIMLKILSILFKRSLHMIMNVIGIIIPQSYIFVLLELAFTVIRLLKLYDFLISNSKRYFIYYNISLYNTLNIKCFILAFNTLK